MPLPSPSSSGPASPAAEIEAAPPASGAPLEPFRIELGNETRLIETVPDCAFCRVPGFATTAS
jgi:hypothetical protein